MKAASGEAKAHLECKVVQIVTDRNTNIVLGRIVHAHVDPSVWKNGRVDPQLLDPVCVNGSRSSAVALIGPAQSNSHGAAQA
jgi:flavin reductase (DIM6/NTAB) family NADH-FMN oxidoreductase RutF